MGVFDLFRKKPQAETESAQEKPEEDEGEVYSGMRVEITDRSGNMLFMARVSDLDGSLAYLHQYSEAAIAWEEESPPLPVRIRGYNYHERKAVYMEGAISPAPGQNRWQVEGLVVTRICNDRAFFRLETTATAHLSPMGSLGVEEEDCRLVNISVGGVCVQSEQQLREGDKFLLKIRLLEGLDLSMMYCQVLRITVKERGRYEYGCRFLEMNEADEERITQIIFAAQRQQRSNSQWDD